MDAHHIIGIAIAIVAIIGGLGIALYVLQKAFQQEFMEKTMNLENISKERLLLIEKGMDPSMADKKKREGSSPLLWGLLLAGVGFGGFAGYMVAHNFFLSGSILIHSGGLFFGGVGLVLYYIIQRRSDAKKAK